MKYSSIYFLLVVQYISQHSGFDSWRKLALCPPNIAILGFISIVFVSQFLQIYHSHLQLVSWYLKKDKDLE